MDKYKKLIGNTSIFFISQFASKMLVFLMLPIYTGYMTEEQYATADMVTTTVGLLTPVLTLCIANAVLRYVMENRGNLYTALKLAINIIVGGFIILLVCYPLIKNLCLFPGKEWLFYLYYITTCMLVLFDNVARAIGRIRLIGVVGVLNTFVTVTLNVVFLVVLKLGVNGYLGAYIIAFSIGILVYIIALSKEIRGYIGNVEQKNLHRDMLGYSIPLVPNSISWWLTSSCNKFFIRFFIGTSTLGLYSAASKLPSILTTIQGIFGEALVLSMIEEYNNEKNNNYYSVLYNMYNLILVICCSFLILSTKLISKLLLSNEFFYAWRYVPFLLISMVFGGLSGFLGNLYSVSKKNRGMFVSTLVGGIVSVVISYWAISSWGVYGATIANMLAYIVIWLYRMIDTRRYIKLNFTLRRDIISYALLIVQASIMIVSDYKQSLYLVVILIFLFVMLLYFQEVQTLVRRVLGMLLKKK